MTCRGPSNDAPPANRWVGVGVGVAVGVGAVVVVVVAVGVGAAVAVGVGVAVAVAVAVVNDDHVDALDDAAYAVDRDRYAAYVDDLDDSETPLDYDDDGWRVEPDDIPRRQ